MKKGIYCSFIIFIILGIYLYINKSDSNNVSKYIQKEVIAYYVDDGNGGYQKQNTIPTGSYVINQEKSKCLAGGTISNYDSSIGTIRYILNGSDRCSVYFDIKPLLTVNLGTVAFDTGGSENVTMEFENGNVLAYKLLSDSSTTYNAATNAGLVKDEVLGGMFRYTSASESATVNNYVCLAGNTTICNNSTQNQNYLYRIIGITKNDPVGNQNGLVKIIKETPIGIAVYNQDSSQTNASATKWGNNDLYKRLNGQTSNGAPIFKNATGYEYLNNLETNGIIVPANWKIKDVDTVDTYTSSQLTSFNALAQYNAENPGNNEDDKLISDASNKHHYGLAYASDFLYSNKDNNTDFPNNDSRYHILNRKGWMYNYIVSEYTCEWSMTRFGWIPTASGVNAWGVYYAGVVALYDVTYEEGRVRSVLYLSSEAEILDVGNGSKSAPYIIKTA